jgi:hypothetical protein
MPIVISPTIASITINGNTYTHSDWENNTPGVLGGLGNDLATEIAALALVGTLTKAISGNTTLTGPESANIGFVFTGALTGTALITFAAGFSGIAQIENQTTGGHFLTCGLVAGTAIAVPPLGSAAAFCDGTNFSLQSGLVRTSVGVSTLGNAAVEGNLAVVGTSTFIGATTVTGAATFSTTANIVGAATVGGTMSVSGATTVDDSLNVTGAATVTGAVSVGGAFNVTGATSIDDNLDVDGSITSWGLTVYLVGVERRIYLGSDSGYSAWMDFQTGAEDRWLIGKNSIAETGSNAGGDFEIVRFDDDGISLGIPIRINRATGNIGFLQLPTSSTGLEVGDLWNNAGVLNVKI